MVVSDGTSLKVGLVIQAFPSYMHKPLQKAPSLSKQTLSHHESDDPRTSQTTWPVVVSDGTSLKVGLVIQAFPSYMHKPLQKAPSLSKQTLSHHESDDPRTSQTTWPVVVSDGTSLKVGLVIQAFPSYMHKPLQKAPALSKQTLSHHESDDPRTSQTTWPVVVSDGTSLKVGLVIQAFPSYMRKPLQKAPSLSKQTLSHHESDDPRTSQTTWPVVVSDGTSLKVGLVIQAFPSYMHKPLQKAPSLSKQTLSHHESDDPRTSQTTWPVVVSDGTSLKVGLVIQAFPSYMHKPLQKAPALSKQTLSHHEPDDPRTSQTTWPVVVSDGTSLKVGLVIQAFP